MVIGIILPLWRAYSPKSAPEFFAHAKSHIFSASPVIPNLKERSNLHIYKRTMKRSSGNYLRVHRKASGFNQDELGAILGCDGGAVSRYELSRSLPSLPLALAFEILFLVPISELFGGLSEAVKYRIEKQLVDLEAELASRSGGGPRAALTAKKLQWLIDHRHLRSGSLPTHA
jgi:transcriptional regulator with XRE-family HTH domain